MSYKLKTNCRACDSADLTPVFDLGVQPLANDHHKPGEACQGFYPLAVNRCCRCGLAQLSVVVDPQVLYSNYTYVTSASDTMRRHFERLFQDIESEAVFKSLVEIGSNDGRLMRFARARGWSGLGIEPAVNLVIQAEAAGTISINSFFDVTSANLARNRAGRPGLILARHCFAHMDDWRGFVLGLEALAGAQTLVCIEVPYVQDLLARVEFDSVYHEHLSYVSLKPIAMLLKSTPFHLHRILRYGIHGGCLLLMLRHNDSAVTPHLSADEYLAEENTTEADWRKFAVEANQKIVALKEVVYRLAQGGKIISAFGASAKATILLNACGFTKKQIAFVTDNSPLKPGCRLPGTDIPIIEEGQMLSEHPDYAVCTAWNYLPEILQKMEKWRSRGGKFIVPDREVQVV